jgi:hypothetical protein
MQIIYHSGSQGQVQLMALNRHYEQLTNSLAVECRQLHDELELGQALGPSHQRLAFYQILLRWSAGSCMTNRGSGRCWDQATTAWPSIKTELSDTYPSAENK